MGARFGLTGGRARWGSTESCPTSSLRRPDPIPGVRGEIMRYASLTETDQTERLKVLGVWAMFRDEDLSVRPHPVDNRGRSVQEQMVHQCLSENLWFRKLLGIDVGARPLPEAETRLGFIREYARDSARRLEALLGQAEGWWEEGVPFFDVERLAPGSWCGGWAAPPPPRVRPPPPP